MTVNQVLYSCSVATFQIVSNMSGDGDHTEGLTQAEIDCGNGIIQPQDRYTTIVIYITHLKNLSFPTKKNNFCVCFLTKHINISIVYEIVPMITGSTGASCCPPCSPSCLG